MNLCEHGNRIGVDYCQECRRTEHEEDMRTDAAERAHLRSLPAPDAGDYGGAFDGFAVTSDADDGL